MNQRFFFSSVSALALTFQLSLVSPLFATGEGTADMDATLRDSGSKSVPRAAPAAGPAAPEIKDKTPSTAAPQGSSSFTAFVGHVAGELSPEARAKTPMGRAAPGAGPAGRPPAGTPAEGRGDPASQQRHPPSSAAPAAAAEPASDGLDELLSRQDYPAAFSSLKGQIGHLPDDHIVLFLLKSNGYDLSRWVRLNAARQAEIMARITEEPPQAPVTAATTNASAVPARSAPAADPAAARVHSVNATAVALPLSSTRPSPAAAAAAEDPDGLDTFLSRQDYPAAFRALRGQVDLPHEDIVRFLLESNNYDMTFWDAAPLTRRQEIVTRITGEAPRDAMAFIRRFIRDRNIPSLYRAARATGNTASDQSLVESLMREQGYTTWGRHSPAVGEAIIRLITATSVPLFPQEMRGVYSSPIGGIYLETDEGCLHAAYTKRAVLHTYLVSTCALLPEVADIISGAQKGFGYAFYEITPQMPESSALTLPGGRVWEGSSLVLTKEKDWSSPTPNLLYFRSFLKLKTTIDFMDIRYQYDRGRGRFIPDFSLENIKDFINQNNIAYFFGLVKNIRHEGPEQDLARHLMELHGYRNWDNHTVSEREKLLHLIRTPTTITSSPARARRIILDQLLPHGNCRLCGVNFAEAPATAKQ